MCVCFLETLCTSRGSYFPLGLDVSLIILSRPRVRGVSVAWPSPMPTDQQPELHVLRDHWVL